MEQSIEYDLQFKKGAGVKKDEVEKLPMKAGGLIAEIHWPHFVTAHNPLDETVRQYLGVTVRHSGNIRAMIPRNLDWARKQHDGTQTKPSEINRQGEINDVAIEYGEEGWENFVISVDDQLSEKEVRKYHKKVLQGYEFVFVTDTHILLVPPRV